jgi:hypothetical protein
MFKITKEHLQTLDASATNGFVNEMVAHARQFFPAACEKVDEKQLRESIRYGMDRAKTYGVVTRRDVALYLNLVFQFGRDFDRDPKLPWAARILNHRDLKNPHFRVQRLNEVAIAYLNEGGDRGA